jgi:hypothetical protein
MIRQNNQFVNPQYLAQAGLLEEPNDAPIYYNLSVNAGLSTKNGVPNTLNNPAVFNEINQTEIVKNSGEYNISVMRCTIPTTSIPRLVVPIQLNQADINLMYNVFTFAYRDATNTIIYAYSLNCQFVSEVLNPAPVGTSPFAYPLPPLPNPLTGEIKQDLRGYYYDVYFVDTILNIFNKCLYDAYQTFRTNLSAAPYSVNIPSNTFPFYSYDESTHFFAFNAPKSLYNNGVDTNLPRVEVYTDALTVDMTLTPERELGTQEYPDPLINKNMVCRLSVVDNINNTITINAVDYLKMVADQSALNAWSGFSRIVFQMTAGISTEAEIDPIPVNYQQASSQSFQKANLPMLCDFEVDKDAWAANSQFIQFVASSINQVRLISITSNNPVKNFTLAVFWVDNFGNRRILNLPRLQPLTVKLAFFKKTLRI